MKAKDYAIHRFRVALPDVHDEATSATTGRDDILILHPSLAYLYPTESRAPRSSTTTSSSSRLETTSHPANARSLNDLQALGERLLHILYHSTDLTALLPLRKHIADDFSANQDHDDNARSREQQLAQWQPYLRRLPDLRVELLDTRVELDSGEKKATMWTFKRFVGLEGGLCREGMSHMRWELRDGVWVAVAVRMLRGVAEFG